jgi:hypothetical protein
MVRTYAFNPSTQNTADYLPGASNHHLSNITLPPLNVQTNQHFQPPNAHHNQHFQPPEQCPFSVYYKNTNSQQRITEDDTAVFGIRSVIINGQRYYQPVDQHLNRLLNEQFQSLKSSPALTQRSNSLNEIRRDAFPAAIHSIALAPPQDPVHRTNSYNFGHMVSTHYFSYYLHIYSRGQWAVVKLVVRFVRQRHSLFSHCPGDRLLCCPYTSILLSFSRPQLLQIMNK